MQCEVCFNLGNEIFSWSGNTLIDPGFTAIQTWHAIGNNIETILHNTI